MAVFGWINLNDVTKASGKLEIDCCNSVVLTNSGFVLGMVNLEYQYFTHHVNTATDENVIFMKLHKICGGGSVTQTHIT